MYKKLLLFIFLAVTHSSMFAMNTQPRPNQAWESDEEDNREDNRSPIETQQTIQALINEKKLGPAAREASQLLRAIEDNPHSSDSTEHLEVIKNIQGDLLELANFKGQSNSPVFRDFETRVETLKATIRCPSNSPVHRSESKNENEDI